MGNQGSKVIGKFSIRTVPNQDPEEIVSLTESYLKNLWRARGSPNRMSVRGEGERGWLADTNTVNFQAAARFVCPVSFCFWVFLSHSFSIILNPL